MGTSQNQPRPNRPYDVASASTAGNRISSAELLRGRQQIEIEHAGETYRLRVTRAGKLILTK